jgi:hypothetical protein
MTALAGGAGGEAYAQALDERRARPLIFLKSFLDSLLFFQRFGKFPQLCRIGEMEVFGIFRHANDELSGAKRILVSI